MNYQVATGVHDAQCSSDLEVISVDPARGIVKVRTKNKDLSTAHQQLNSEDAKSLGLREVTSKGVSNPIIKHATIMFGDDKTGEPKQAIATRKTKDFRPFLVVEFNSSSMADLQFSGDSVIN